MKTPASIAGHPIHPMLVPIAIGGFVLSFAFDLVCAATGAYQPWGQAALFTMMAGIAAALMAAVPGLIDMLSLSGPVKKIAITHMVINLAVVGLYIFNVALRYGNPNSLMIPIALSFLAIALLVVSGWLGGKMVYEHGVGVGPNP